MQAATRHLPESARFDSSLKLWLAVIDGALRAVEQSVWQGRALAEQALKAWQGARAGADLAAAEYQALMLEARRWPARLRRLSATGWMLARMAMAYRFWSTRSAFLPRSRWQSSLDQLHRTHARRFRDVSLRHGGAFLKIGQLLSSRPDLLPDAWVEELAVLQDQAAPEPADTIVAVIEEQLGATMEALFATFDPEPIAAASIGQVHRARLHDGREVAVKVQRPGLEEVIALDMALLRLFMDSLRSLLPPMDLDTITAEIERTVAEELDYRREAAAMTRVAETLRDAEHVSVPAVVRSHSGKRVLTSEFVVGEKLTRYLDRARDAGEHRVMDDVLGRLLDAWLRQVLVAGEFQADPHPGNILVTPEGALVLLDFGCTARLPDAFRRGYFQVMRAAIVGDAETVADTLAGLGFATRSGSPATLLAFTDALLEQFRTLLTVIDEGGIRWPDADALAARARELMAHMEADPVVTMPAEFVMLARVFGTLAGLFLHYRPQLDVNRYVLPYMLLGD